MDACDGGRMMGGGWMHVMGVGGQEEREGGEGV